MQLQRVLESLRAIAPEHLAESWDHVGHQLGSATWPMKRGLLCIDLTAAVLREAVADRAELIVTYHPPIFTPLPALTDGDPRQKLILEAARRQIAIYSPHTALDAAAGGINDWLCESVLPGLLQAVGPEGPKGALARGGQVRPIRPSGASTDQRPYKLVTYVPPEHLDKLFAALCAAGAGQIGAYSECSFSSPGQGTFRGGPGTHPSVGLPGVLEKVTEQRLETIVAAPRIAAVVAALMQAHPYEEPAFDLIRLELPPSSGGEGVGQGRVVQLDRPIALAKLLTRIKTQLGIKSLEAAIPPGLHQVRRIGFCAGAGGSLLQEAGPLDAYVTGEMRHHDVLAAVEHGTAIILAGHTQTERPFLPTYRRRLEQSLGPAVKWSISSADRPPLREY